jgi:hypothetical protein
MTSPEPHPLLRWTGLAFLYWLACMTALEPGNLAGMWDAGMRPDLGMEALRLVAAGLLGASATPALALLARRLPLEPGRSPKNLVLQGVAVIALMLVLILVSTVLAAWLREGRPLPRPRTVTRELLANGLLVAACLAGFLGLMQLARRRTGPVQPTHLSVTARGRVLRVELAAIDWIESQGNYQALHVGAGVHLLRDTQAGLAARLDPARFQRIHRRVVVALDRVVEVRPLANGDGLVRLRGGEELRLARGFRDALRHRLAQEP